MIETAAQMLIDGTPGHQVKDWIRRSFVDAERNEPRSLSGLNSTMSLVRSAVIARGVILPASMNSFWLSGHEARQLQIDQEQAQMRKNEDINIIRIDNAPRLLKGAIHLLETAKPTDTYARLILPLLMITGRRLSEICGGKAVFAPVEGRSTYAHFSGQLKQGADAESYVIPLLCDFKTFAIGWLALQQRQQVKGNKKRGAEAELSHKETAARYGGNTNKYLAKGKWLPLPKYGQKKGSTEQKSCHAHDLRSIYMAYVYEMYDCPDTFNRSCMRVLGHQKLAESLSYNNVSLSNCDDIRNSLGQLQMV